MSKFQIQKFIKPHLLQIETYKSVDPPDLLAQKAGIPHNKIIKLNGNENPYGGSKKAAEAVANTPLHVYPDPLQRKIRKSLSKYTGMDEEYLIAGAGSDELIDLLFRLFISPGDKILDFDPTFAMYGFCARVAGGKVEMVPRNDVFEIDFSETKNYLSKETKIIFISSPNNPTGNLASDDQIKTLLDSGLIVVVDEAYYEFSNHTVAGLVPMYENLVVLRTMSKWAGLAGLRIGYGIMSPNIVNHIIDIKSPYNVNVAAEAALIASVEDAPALMQKVHMIVEERGRMYELLKELPGLNPWPSHGNYILCEFDSGKSISVFEALAKKGIFVRNFDSKRLRNCLRIAVGTPDQTDSVIVALREIL